MTHCHGAHTAFDRSELRSEPSICCAVLTQRRACILLCCCTHMSLPQAANVLPLEGEIDLHVAPELTRTFAKIIESRPSRLVVDLSAVKYIDSSGLAILIRAVQDVESYGGRLMIAAARKNVRFIIDRAKLSEFFITFPHVDAALAAV
jgi:anti-sigma B factor antagonist